MAKTRGAHSFKPHVRRGPTPPATGPSPTAGDPAAAGSIVDGPSAAAVGAGLTAPNVGDAEGSSSVAPAQRRYHSRAGPTPPAPSQPRLA